MATIRQLHFCSIEVNSPASVSIMILVLEALKEILKFFLQTNAKNHKNRLDTPTPNFCTFRLLVRMAFQTLAPPSLPKTKIFIIRRWSMARRSGDNAGIYWSMETHPASLPQLVEVFSGFPELRQPLHGHLAGFYVMAWLQDPEDLISLEQVLWHKFEPGSPWVVISTTNMTHIVQHTLINT